MKKILVLILVLFFYKSFSQSNDSLIHSLLQDIQSMQVKQDGEFYAGQFPSFRECGGTPHNYQPDNNIFYTAVTAFALRNMLPHLNEADKKIAEDIIERIRKIYSLFRNKHGFPYYGFWAIKDPIMPHTYFYKYLKQVFGQGEDADDTVMILMTDSSSDKDVTDLKKRLEAVANLSTQKRKIISTYKKYKDVHAYCTYLGSRTTPDFDFAVQCNILYFVLDKHLPFVKQDSATLHLITEMVRNREYAKTPTYISPYYVRSSVLIYHVVRLMSAFNIPELNVYKQQLIDDAKKEFDEGTNVMDKILLSTSLMKLGVHDNYFMPPFKTINEFENTNQQQYAFFQARTAYSYPTPFKQIMLYFSYINYYFYCPAYYKVLWLENLVLSNRSSK
ncbi:MAG: hypothetical protein JO072_10435 [Parafilimonas sp.]|nr:hypothetical protein [Parafilimonas sp.]